MLKLHNPFFFFLKLSSITLSLQILAKHAKGLSLAIAFRHTACKLIKHQSFLGQPKKPWQWEWIVGSGQFYDTLALRSLQWGTLNRNESLVSGQDIQIRILVYKQSVISVQTMKPKQGFYLAFSGATGSVCTPASEWRFWPWETIKKKAQADEDLANICFW